jgi:dolichol-phosphate mannosyltransferase
MRRALTEGVTAGATCVSTPIALTIVVPVYGCDDCLAELCRQIAAALADLAGEYEILLIDDRSPDGSWAQIVALQAIYPQLRALRFSRNFGQQIAITAGLAAAQGARVAVMDCDLQDPPALLPAMMVQMDMGADIVQCRRTPQSRAPIRRMLAAGYGHFLGLVTGARVDPSLGSFSLLSRKVVDAYLRFGERERHYQFILHWLGFETAYLDYAHAERHAGRSSYKLRKLIAHALDGVFFQSTRLLHWITALGTMFAAGGFIFAGYVAWRAIFRTALPGWTSLAFLILIGTGFILMSLGVIGIYVGKVFAQTKGRPLYIIDEEVGLKR